MERDHLQQLISLQGSLSNLRISATSDTNSIYRSNYRLQESILNRSPPLGSRPWTPNIGAVAAPTWFDDPFYAPLPSPVSPRAMQFPTEPAPSIYHLPPALLNPMYLTAAPQQNMSGYPYRYNTPSEAASSSLSADTQRRHFSAADHLQESIRNMSRENIDIEFLKVLVHIDEMMTHHSENYIVQRLIEVADDSQKHRLVEVLYRKESQLRQLCCDTHGTRVVQKLVENLHISYQKVSLLSALRPYIIALALNDNGRHVIIQCLRNFSDEENEPIFTAVARHCFSLGRHKNGYLVLTECISCNPREPNVALVHATIAQNALFFSHDQYGNYVVQQALAQHVPQLTIRILSQLQGNYIHLSESKYGSNVVEKCLNFCRRDQVELIINEILQSEVSRLVSHPFGNYVMQTLLTVTKNQRLDMQHRELLALLRIHIAELKISTFGRQLMKWIPSSSR